MKKIIIKASLILMSLSASVQVQCKDQATRGLAQWSVVTYIAADNSLDQFAYYNIDAMQKGVIATDQVNILVQWDKPQDNQTWRYRITPGGKIEVDSINSEMGYEPSREVVNCMQWVVDNYPALHYATILWNHGSGVQDFSPGEYQRKRFERAGWMRGLIAQEQKPAERGILYDDSQGTCLTNQGMINAFTAIKGIIGRNLDVLGMDACLMSMLEIAGEMSDVVDYLVASEQPIPGQGWEYKGLFGALTAMPTMSPRDFALTAVNTYGKFYRKQGGSTTYTLAALDLSQVKNVENGLAQVIALINSARKNSSDTIKLVKAARTASIQMDDFPEYIDLGVFFEELMKRFGDKNKSAIKNTQDRLAFNRNARSVRSSLQSALSALDQFVIGKVSNAKQARTHGLAIYYPQRGAVHSSYMTTPFSQNSDWVNFIKTYKSA